MMCTNQVYKMFNIVKMLTRRMGIGFIHRLDVYKPILMLGFDYMCTARELSVTLVVPQV